MDKKYRKYYLAILFVVALVLLPTHQAQANWLTDWAFEAVFANVLFVVFTLVGKVIGVLAIALNWVIHIPVYPDGGLPVVDESWKIMRNFANMFFIIALIIMAFATIFNITKYEARTLFPKFLISALLINFSLVLGVLVIDASQVLTNTFLVSIGDMSLRLGQELNPSKLLPSEDNVAAATKASAGTAIDAAVFGSLVSLLFSVVLLFTFLFSILTAFLFAIIRIPILWALLIVSPIAWILNVFPAGQGTYKKWWKVFIGWNMFLPIFLFFLYFGLYFLQSQDDVIQKIASNLASAQPTSDLPFSFQLLFFYVLTAIFLIGGTITAMKASMFSGTGVVGVAKWSRGVAARRFGLTAAGGAATQKLEQVQKEGLPTRFGQAIFGGQRALDLETARRARQLGVRGALEKGVDIEKEKQKPFAHDINRLNELAASGSKEQRLAARGRLTELGAISGRQISETYQMYGGDRSESANKYISGVDFSKLSTDDRKNFSESLTNIEARKKNALAMIEKDKLDENEIVRLAGQFTNTAEVREFLDKGSKKNLIDVARARVNLALEGVGTIDEEIDKAFKKITDDQIIETMGDPSFNSSNPDYQIMVDKMKEIFNKNPKRLETLVAKAPGGVRTNLEPILRGVRTNQVKPLAAKGQKITSQIRQAQQELVNINNELTLKNNALAVNNNPTSGPYKQLQKEIDDKNRERTAKETEVKSLQDKRTKIGEQIRGITSGTPPTP